jgi:hypothetical protein
VTKLTRPFSIGRPGFDSQPGTGTVCSTTSLSQIRGSCSRIIPVGIRVLQYAVHHSPARLKMHGHLPPLPSYISTPCCLSKAEVWCLLGSSSVWRRVETAQIPSWDRTKAENCCHMNIVLCLAILDFACAL